MRIFFLLFIIAGIFFQSQAQTKKSLPPPDSIGNISTKEHLDGRMIVEDVDGGTTVEENIPDSMVVYYYAQVMPAFPNGGDTAFTSFIKKNLVYPEDAKQRNITGTVFVQFIIERDGSLSSISVIPGKGISPSCDQAAIDVISKSPRWSPGMLNNKTVRISRAQRIRFL